MQIRIVSRYDASKVLFEGEFETLASALVEAVSKGADLRGADLYGASLYGADLRGANLYGADLRGASLYGANLGGADLYGADLRGADLRGANLGGANLYGANLRGANLYGANLGGASLGGASLYGANLRGANLYGANLGGASLGGASLGDDAIINDAGETLGFWKTEVMPALLAAAPHAVSAAAWNCHSWENCPMHEAFGIRTESEAPPLLRARVKEFVRFFDAGLIKGPAGESAACAIAP
jgi:hypothetical protein